MSSAAARVGDPISHTSALDGFLAGLAIGAGVALAGVAIVGTGGLAAVAVVGAAASGGAAIGQMFGSMSTSEAGAITSGSPNVRINGIPAARAHVDHAACSKHSHKEVIAMGSAGVRINGLPAARVDDKTACSGIISSGSGNVRIGGGTVQTDEINPEIPQWLSWTVYGIGIISTGYFLWVAPVLTMGGIAGSVVGEKAGSAIGGAYFGEGSNEQAMFALGGAVVGGLFGARGGQAFHSRYRITFEGLGSNFGNLRIRPVNGRLPLNGTKYAGQTVPLSELPKNLRAKYPHSVPFNGAGFPDFSRYSIRNVRIQLGPTRSVDFARADKLAGFSRANPRPKGYTWHHHQEPGYMQLVPTDIHAAIKHTGGIAVSR